MSSPLRTTRPALTLTMPAIPFNRLDEQNPDARLAGRADQRLEHGDLVEVETGCRLVEHDHDGVERERARQIEDPRLGERRLRCRLLREVRNPERVEERLRAVRRVA